MQRAQHGKCQQAARQQISPCAQREQEVAHHQHHHARKTIHQIPAHKACQHRGDAVPRHHPADGVLICPELAAQVHREKRRHEHEGEEQQEIRHPGAGIVRCPQARNRLVLNAGIHGCLHLYAPPFPRSITKSAIVTWNHFNLRLQYIQDRADFVQTKTHIPHAKFIVPPVSSAARQAGCCAQSIHSTPRSCISRPSRP